jgi:predicted dehydrogenase
MVDKMINWGIIGCGNVTEVTSGPAFNKVPGSNLVAVMRRNAEKAKDYAERHRVAKWYTDATALINDPEVNAIYVATPPASHEEYALQSLRAGKPVYVEKPIAIDSHATERMALAVKESGVKLSVAHYRRQQPLFLKIKSILEQKLIGETRMVNLQLYQPHESKMIAKTEENWRINPSISGGGLFYDLAPHQLDLMLYFFGKPKHVAGISFNAFELYGADDTTSGQVLFQENVLFNGSWCFNFPEYRDSCEIIGDKGSIRFSIFDHQPVKLIIEGKESTFEFDKLEHVQQPMIENVVQYFLGNETNPCSVEEGLEVMKMMEAITALPGSERAGSAR